MSLYNYTKEGVLSLNGILKSAMDAHSLSLRGLSELCGISPSTVSRILNGKQSANIGHLQAFSKHLQIPLARLLRASGLEIAEHTNENSQIVIKMIGEILQSYNVDLDEIVPEIQKDLKKYEQYAKTALGKEAVQSGFDAKIDGLNGEGIIIDQLKKLHVLYCSEETPTHIQSIAGSVLLYLISMPDIIPDYAFPLGYLDDAIAVGLTTKRLADEFDIVL